MALDYFLDLATDMTPAQALGEISRQLQGLSWSEDRFFLFDDTVSISATGLPKGSQELCKSNFGFTPTILVGFRMRADGDQERFRDVLLQATLLLLEKAQDAIILFNGEAVTLQRIRGQLAFNADSDLWHDEGWLRRKVQVPFEFRPLPSPYL
jgi:hypothetical protein